MKQRKNIEAYLTQKDNRILETVFIALTAVGAILVLLWTFFYMWIGIIGIPLLLVGGGGWMITHSSRVTEEDFDKEVKRIISVNDIEENGTTLKEYIVGKSEHIKRGRDKKIRTAYYSVSVFNFKKENCTIKKYTVDLFEESYTLAEYNIAVGCDHKITEKDFTTAIGEITRSFLVIHGDDEVIIPVDTNVYDTDEVIKRITHKR